MKKGWALILGLTPLSTHESYPHAAHPSRRVTVLVYGRSVLLLAHVATSGNSLRATRRRLLEAGAFRVKMLALAQTRPA